MDSLKDIRRTFSVSDMTKTAEELQGDMDALLSGSTRSPLVEHARSLDKIAHAISPLGRSELVDGQMKDPHGFKKTAEPKKEAKAPEVSVDEKVASVSDEDIDDYINKIAQFEDGLELIKEAEALGRNAAILDVNEIQEKTALSVPGMNSVRSFLGNRKVNMGALEALERAGVAKELGVSPAFSRASGSAVGGAVGAGYGAMTAGEGESKMDRAMQYGTLGAGAGLLSGQAAREIAAHRSVGGRLAKIIPGGSATSGQAGAYLIGQDKLKEVKALSKATNATNKKNISEFGKAVEAMDPKRNL